jgi:hypothetical protein
MTPRVQLQKKIVKDVVNFKGLGAKMLIVKRLWFFTSDLVAAVRIARHSPKDKNMSSEAEKSIFGAVARQRLVKSQKTLRVLKYNDL